REDRANHRERHQDERPAEQRQDDAERAEVLRVGLEPTPEEEWRGRAGAADHDRREQRSGKEPADADLPVQEVARRPEPEGQRAGEPERDQGDPARSPELTARGDPEPEQPADGEEPDREPSLVGERPHLDLPRPGVDVLVDLADADAPDKEP